ncbi:STN domain-containing protein, partial [Sphingobium sp.]|uniref:STN domain-containing protein n=1 Tax=Sphingobium sp. TaxID=1912891 RepID=UPI002C17D2C8
MTISKIGAILLGTSAGALAISTVTASPAHAQERILSIPAQPLDKAIKQLALDTRHAIIADTSVTRGLMSGPLNGSYSAAEALDRMLAGTMLEAVPVGRTLVVRRQRGGSGQASFQKIAQLSTGTGTSTIASTPS